jgi:hypothetical protein
MQTQWRHGGPLGLVGLDYGVLDLVFGMVGVMPERRSEVFDDLRRMEQAALEWLDEQRKAG